MGMSVGEKSGGLNSEINITPLADVMLVLLIIVMLIAPLLQAGVLVPHELRLLSKNVFRRVVRVVVAV